MPDTQPTIPAEAMDAALAEWKRRKDEGIVAAPFEHTEALLAAALPHLAQHVSPSVEDVARTLEEADVDFSAREASADAGRTQDEPGDWFAAMAQAVLALLSSQPTVEQVRRETREQVAREIEACPEPGDHDRIFWEEGRPR